MRGSQLDRRSGQLVVSPRDCTHGHIKGTAERHKAAPEQQVDWCSYADVYAWRQTTMYTAAGMAVAGSDRPEQPLQAAEKGNQPLCR
jgi:hypothetical protein